MKFKIIFFLILSLGIFSPIFAQNHFFGVKGGIALTNINFSPSSPFSGYEVDLKYKVGIATGLSYDLLLKKHLLFSVDFLYNDYGLVAQVETKDPDNNTISVKFTDHFEYLSLPIKVGYQTKGKIFGYGSIGFVPSLLLKSSSRNQNYNESGTKYSDFIRENTTGISKFDIAALIEVGLGVRINGMFSLATSFAFRHSLNQISSNSNTNGQRHYSFTYFLGLKYQFPSQKNKK